MHPTLFKWRGITVWSYPALLYIGLVSGVVAGNLAAHAAGLDPLRVYIATLVLLVPALAGARLLYVAAEWPHYRGNLHRIWNRQEGGYIMYGGLPAMLLFSVPVLRLLHLSIPAFWDVAIFTVMAGMFFTRIGCLLNGCCAGRPARSWGLNLPNHRGVWEKRIPTQALEAVWAAVLLGCAVALRKSMPFPGALFLVISLGYAGGRLLMELGRERSQTPRKFSIVHVISLLVTLLSVSTLTIFWRT